MNEAPPDPGERDELPSFPEQRETLIRIVKLLAPYKWQYIIAILSGGLAALTTLALAPLSGNSLDRFASTAEQLEEVTFLSGLSQGEAIFWMAGLLVGALIVRYLAKAANNWFTHFVIQNFAADLREEVYGHIQKLSFSTLDRSRTGDLMARVTNDVKTLSKFLENSLKSFLIAPVYVLGGIGYIAYKEWRVLVLMVVIMAVVGAVIYLMTPALRRVNQRIQQIMADLTSELQEGISILRLIQTQGTEEEEFNKYREINREGLSERLRFEKYASILIPGVEFVGFLGPLTIFVYAAWLISQGLMTPGDLIALAGVAGMLISPVKKLSRIFVELARGTAPAERIFYILDTPVEIEDEPGAEDLEECRGKVEFRDVSFHYDGGEQVFEDFDLEIRPGMEVALVGASGAGKTTLLNLIPRFYQPQEGTVLVDDRDVRDITLDSLRSHVGYVAQETQLFHGTVRENIMYGCEGVDEIDMLDAATAAAAHDFIQELSDGYDTMLGEGGVGLSGGQKQRIAIARALLKDPAILLLDEPTSALDRESELLVQRALEKLMYGRTTLIAAHRLTTVKNADLIVVLEEGAITERGTHAELLERGGTYASFYTERADAGSESDE